MATEKKLNLEEQTVKDFTEATFSRAPVPGGGGVAAVVGSLGTALGGMVCNLTTGKKKYAQYEEDICRLLSQLEDLTAQLLALAEEDAENFAPLSALYALPTETEEQKQEKHREMQAALRVAVSAPISMMKLSYQALTLLEELLEKGSKLVLSDVGCGALCLKSALEMGWLNVKINLSSMEDEAYKTALQEELLPLLSDGEGKADRIYRMVEKEL